jgi:hypothetical protein
VRIWSPAFSPRRNRRQALDAKFKPVTTRSAIAATHLAGWPAARRATQSDTRLTSIDPKARAAAHIAFEQVLSVYPEAQVVRDALAAMAGKIEGAALQRVR